MSNRPTVHKSRSGSRPSGGPAGAGSNPLLKWMIIGVVALVAAAVGVALLASRDAEQAAQTDVPQVSDVSIEGAPLPRFEGE
ncbi:MAG: hypothetical protein F4232_00240, partial [Acidimicrobiaceae bacterium]|nr:hypothetical protein [Acidimicrobiaceae bacterium]